MYHNETRTFAKENELLYCFAIFSAIRTPSNGLLSTCEISLTQRWKCSTSLPLSLPSRQISNGRDWFTMPSYHKNGFAFVYFKDERDAINAIRFLRDMPFGKAKRKLTVEWAGGERGRRHSVSASNQSPTNTLFVINFDPIHTKEHDIERHFEPYGKVLNVRICRNFAFVDFETQEAAIRALEHTHTSKILDSVVSVDHARQIPTKTLFVINFDPIHTGEHDIERHFEPYGKVLNVRIRRDFAFVRFETQEDATKALECTHMSKISDRVISVMYALRDDDNRGGRYDIPYGRREYGASWRSPSRYHRWGRIPDYGRYNGPLHIHGLGVLRL